MLKLSTPKNTRSYVGLNKPTTLAVAKGGVVMYSPTTGLLQVAGASASQADLLYLSSETISAADAKGSVHALALEHADTFIADTVNNTNATHTGQRMVLDATGLLVNNTGTDAPAGVFEQVATVGAAAEKKILVKRV